MFSSCCIQGALLKRVNKIKSHKRALNARKAQTFVLETELLTASRGQNLLLKQPNNLKELDQKNPEKFKKLKHNRLTSGELLSNDRRAVGFVIS